MMLGRNGLNSSIRALLIGAFLVSFATSAFAFVDPQPKDITFPNGVVKVVDNGDGTYTFSAKRKFATVSAIFPPTEQLLVSNTAVVFVPGPDMCPAEYYVVTLKTDELFMAGPFGNCTDAAEITEVEGGKIRLEVFGRDAVRILANDDRVVVE